MLKGLRTAIYKVSDLERATAWYTKILGFGPYFEEPFYVGFNVGGFEMGLDPDMDGVRPGNNTVAYWGVDDCAAVYERLIKSGAKPHSAPQEVGGGIIAAAVIDPFDNIFGIIENPHFKLDH